MIELPIKPHWRKPLKDKKKVGFSNILLFSKYFGWLCQNACSIKWHELELRLAKMHKVTDEKDLVSWTDDHSQLPPKVRRVITQVSRTCTAIHWKKKTERNVQMLPERRRRDCYRHPICRHTTKVEQKLIFSAPPVRPTWQQQQQLTHKHFKLS